MQIRIHKKLILSVLCFLAGLISTAGIVPANTVTNGGGYAVTGQIKNTGYTTRIYDATNGLPTSDANYVLASSDGYIWIGGYSGIIRYDGSNFTRMDTTYGLTSGRGLFEDSKSRIWVGTNDNGVVVIEGDRQTHITYREGLLPSSIRVFAEDPEGNVFVGTTAGVYCISDDFLVSALQDERLSDERILRLDSDSNGVIYGQTKNGLIFSISDKTVTSMYSGEDLAMEHISTILADPDHAGMVYLGTETGSVYYGKFGDKASDMTKISVDPLTEIHWMSYDCGRLWISSTDAVGYIDTDYGFHKIDIPLNSGIEMMTSDYQGNMWFASSTQGVMKIVANNFVDLTAEAGLPEIVTNAACFYKNDLYIGTDRGLTILDENRHPLTNALTEYIGDARIRCIAAGTDDDLWIGAYTNNLGLVHLSKDGSITSYNASDGLPDSEIRSINITDDGSVLVGSNGGLTIIKNGKIDRVIDASDGIKNTVSLTVEEGDDGKIYVGTDGGGIYTVDGTDIRHIGRDEGLTSDVIMRIKKDEKHGVIWLITSNSIEYMKDGVIHPVTTFPYNNNYDIYSDETDNMWIISSYGIYMVNGESMLADDVSEYRLYTTENGLTGTPTTLSYGVLDDEGYLYIPVRNGISRVNIHHISMTATPIKVAISSIYYGEDKLTPDKDGKYIIPSGNGRIRITPAVLDYTMLNPEIRIYMEGDEDDGIKTMRSNMQTLEYTGLAYGNYTLHISVMDNSGKQTLVDESFQIVKKPHIMETGLIRVLFLLFLVLITVVVVLRVMNTTVIRRQYAQIRQAKEEAERASTAKSRFLANMSHDIRTPISTIMGMNEMILRENATGVPKEYFMSIINYSLDIKKASESLLSLISDLLDMSKIESGNLYLTEEEYDITEMLRSIVPMIRERSTEKGLNFDVDVDEMLPCRLLGDYEKVKQILINLLTNAIKYTDIGGFSLHVSIIEMAGDDITLRFSVRDTGKGIRIDDLDKLFNAYDRLDEHDNGNIHMTGLGLDISRRFAEKMGAELTCNSVYGKGSEFILTIKQHIIDKTPVGAFDENGVRNTLNGPYIPQFVAPDADILIVDDNAMNLNVIKNLLSSTRVFVTTAESGEECLDKIRDTRFDVVLLDHMMPGMRGTDTIARIRETNPDLPVYALTTNTTEGEDYYTSLGYNGYLLMPIDSVALERTIMRHLPDETMEKPAENMLANSSKELPQEMRWLMDTEGLSVQDGLKNFVDVSNYIFSLTLFLDTIDSNVTAIREALAGNDLNLYYAKVHALKKSADIIGAADLSALADDLENAAKKGEKAVVNEKTPALLKEYEAFKDKLAGIRGDAALKGENTKG
ncbi:MAG: response regulator [Lachnospiraceae bacterium]|nr:response regulator [Lachnospiraceae bacterium]